MRSKMKRSSSVSSSHDLMAGLPERIEGADELHRVLVSMLEACGQRATTAFPL